MRADSPRWHEISTSEFPHEQEGLARVRELLPDRAPFHAWSNFEFRDADGKWHEVDLLVLGERRLHLVELKHYRGLITGTAYRWQRGGRSEDSPLLLARRKAQRLKKVIVDAVRDLQPGVAQREIPYVKECVFLHAPEGRVALAPADTTDLFGPDGHDRRSGLPGISERLLEPVGPHAAPRLVAEDDLLAALFERIGFAVRRERQVGSWRLVGAPEAEGEGWQDWPAEHRVARDDKVRIRFFVTPPGATEAQRGATRQLVEREYKLTSRLHHDGLLRPRDLVEDELGVGLVYPRDESARRLDLWLADQPGGVPLDTQVRIIRQLAEAVAYAHRHDVVHRGLSPAAVFISTRGRYADHLTVRLGDWQVAGLVDPAARQAGTQGAATRLFRVLEGRAGAAADPDRQRAEAYLAPEGRWDPAADRVRLDVFALGAVAYHVVAGRSPAATAQDLRDRLARDRGLDLAAEVPEAPASLRRLVLEATRPVVSERLRDVTAFLALLADVDREVAAPGGEVGEDPLDAPPGTLLGQRFELVRRLGSGSTAVGLLVTDRDTDGERRVLKVAVDDAAARRLADEAEVLRTLRRLDHPRIVRLAEEQPLRVGGRTALLLDSAGDETLADVLRERPRLSLDLLERWGTDLLEALVGLDKAGVDHRDIKPANLGVREQRSDRAKHLVLFDFSLSRAGAAAVAAGTPPYLDPFLGTPVRPRWDSAAERYAAAVTLYEMATGSGPVYGDGRSDPAVLTDEATVEPGAFDPSIAAGLTAFFRTALRRDARQRHDTAAEMLAAWRAVFAGTPTTVPDDADARAAAATPDTSLAEAGLSARALSALEPLGLATAGDLAAVDPGRLSRLTGVADPTRREVRSRAKQWRDRFAAWVATRTPTTPAPSLDDPLADPVATAEVLARASGGPRAVARRHAARVLLGLEGDADAFATLVELAAALGLGGAPQVSRVLADLQEAWAADPDARERLDRVLPRAVHALEGLGGVAAAADLAAAVAGDGAAQAVTGTDAARHRTAAGLLRAALDRADVVERGGGDPAPLVRRRRRGERGDRTLLLATDPALLDAADALAARADALVSAARDAGEHVVPASRAAGALRDLWPAGLLVPDEPRLVRLAARLSRTAAASRRGELHDRHLDAAHAVRLALGGLAPAQRLTAEDVAGRVRARFPDLPALPGRPRLDQVLADAGLPLRWDGEAYAIPSRRPDTTGLASRTVLTAIPVARADAVRATRQDALLSDSAASRSFLALGVRPGRLDVAATTLTARHGAAVVDVTAVLVAALRAQAEAAGIPWGEVTAADAAEPGTRPAMGLAELVARALPTVEQAITEASDGAPAGSRPVLLVEAAPLARYGHTGVLARLADITTPRQQAVWLLLPMDADAGAALDGTPVPLAHGGQFLRLDDDWLRAAALEGEPA